MNIEIPDVNLYKVGTIIYAKVNPTLQLFIAKYYKQIYYCGVVGHPEENNLAYFERELTPAGEQFTLIPAKMDSGKFSMLNPKSFIN
jgi:hypothetical protein